MEQGYDEELEKLLREIPRATSAPLHLDEAQSGKAMSKDESRMMKVITHLPHNYQSHPTAFTSSITLTDRYDDSHSLIAPLGCDSHDFGKGKNKSGSSSSFGNLLDPTNLFTDSSYASRLPSSLQFVDSFPHKPSELLENELPIGIEKMSLGMENRPIQDIRFLHRGQVSVNGGPGLIDQAVSGASMTMHQQQVVASRVHSSPNLSYPSDLKMIYAQQLHEAHVQQQLEERIYCRQRIKEEFLLRQQKLQEQQAQFYASLHNPSGPPSYTRSYSGSQLGKVSNTFDLLQPQASSKNALSGIFASDDLQTTTQERWANQIMLSQEVPQASLDICQYFLHGYCSRGDLCPFPHSQSSAILMNNSLMASDSNISRSRRGPRNIQSASALVLPPSKTKSMLVNDHLDVHILPNQLSSAMHGGGSMWKGISPEVLVSQHQLNSSPPPPPKYTSLKEVEGHIYGIAKDQHGCRFLQKKFEEGLFEDVQKIFLEIIDHVAELMIDPFGNYLIQKLLEVCDEAQRMEILCRVTGNGQLVTISLNMHGTRAVQKLIETLKTPEQIGLAISSLRHGAVTLIKDLNGNHVVQRCLQRLSTEDSQFIFDAATSHCVEIATHRHGCCVLQRCVDFSTGQQRERLVAEIAANALVLSQDPFGNYVVQYILDLGLTWAVTEVIVRLDGNFVHLAMQKFSSNVVEKCLKLGGEESKGNIIRELTSSSRLSQLLQDPFANYVVQSALTVAKGSLYIGLVEAIRPHLPALRSSPYGKRILSRTSLKK